MADTATFQENPLLVGLKPVQAQIVSLKERAKKFYFHVVLDNFRCPKCGGKLQMTSVSRCSCNNGHTLDPTLVFQKSSCCSACLVRKTFHYVCSCCNKTNPSRFLFDERVFDHAYFSKMMQKHRDKIQKQKEKIIKQMQEARSDNLLLLDEPRIDLLPGLLEDLDRLVTQGNAEPKDTVFDLETTFAMTDYRKHILSSLWHLVAGYYGPIIGNVDPPPT